MKISHKLLLIMVILFLSPLVNAIVTLTITAKQQSDGLVINLAGRQRMLSQKITKDCLSYVYAVNSGNSESEDKAKKSVQSTMAVFEATLNSLISSGEAPLSLDMAGEKIHLPAADGDVAAQLSKVSQLWKPFRGAINRVLDSGQETDIQEVLNSNMPLLANMNKAVVMMQKQGEKRVRLIFITTAVCFVIGALVVVGILFWINKNISKPIQSVVGFAQKMASGDLTQNLSTKQNDEIGQMADSLNEMSSNINQMISDISDSVNTLSSSSNEMTDISKQMASVADNTVAKSNTVASAAEEMNTNMETVAAAMEEASINVKTVAASSGEMSQNLGKVTEETASAQEITEQAVEQTGKASVQVNELGQAAEEIGMVTETIKAISDKTNLLALNATIEAARAGEAGKGFAVVANEIKDLAQQTANATEDIAKKLQGIQQSTGNTVKEIEEVSGIMNEVSNIVNSITNSIGHQNATTSEISENVLQASQGLDEIAENVAQSSQAVGQVTVEITEVNDGANDMSNSGAQVQQNAVELAELADKLKEMVGKFTV